MGIGKNLVKALLEEGIKRPFTGKILTLGRQDIFFTFKELEKIAKNTGFRLKESKEILSLKPSFAKCFFLSDNSFFQYLGFEQCFSLDYSDYENVDYIFDLNSETVPSNLTNAFDLILDAGTIEHVFHLPNALKNVFQLLRTDGRIIHLLPSSNYVEHGFYMFSPSLFWEYYKTNQFEMNDFYFIQHWPNVNMNWVLKKYEPNCLDGISYGGLNSYMYAFLCIVTKRASSTYDQIPTQVSYLLPEIKESRLKKAIRNKALFYKPYLFFKKLICNRF